MNHLGIWAVHVFWKDLQKIDQYFWRFKFFKDFWRFI